jgi:Cys-rich protein (TIGR01571 family)
MQSSYEAVPTDAFPEKASAPSVTPSAPPSEAHDADNVPLLAAVQPPVMTMTDETQRTSVTGLPSEQQGQHWRFGLCSCCDDPETCIVSCCCCVPCQTVKLHSFLIGDNPPAFLKPGLPLALCVFGHFVAGGLAQVFHHWYVRARLVRHLDIRGEDECGTFLTACICTSCSSAQLTRHLMAQGVPARLGMSGNDPRSLLSEQLAATRGGNNA